jgi:hypothetical protein
MARTPFYGRNDTKIAKMDMQAATAPGRAYRDAFENLGKVAVDTLEKFRERKEEKEREDNFERMANKLPSEVFSAFGVQSEEEKSDFIKNIKKEGPRKDAMAIMSFFQKAQDAQSAKDVRDSQMALIRQNMDRQKDAGQLANEARMKEETEAQLLDKYLVSREMIGKQMDRTDTNPLMKNVPGPTVQVPQGDLMGNRFMQTEQGKSDFKSMVEAGIDPSNALEIAGKREAQLLARMPKPLSPSDELAREEFEYKKSQDLNKPNLTDGEKSRDKKFGDQLVEFNLPDINKGLEQLTEASEALSKSDTLTGPIVSLMPNFVGDRVNPEAAEVREAVEEVVQRNLRLVLGAQFTEKEGERLISRAYNPTLDEAENKKRVERLIKSIQDAAQEKLNMKSYFEKNGTLKGYNSSLPSITSIEQSAFGDSAPADQSILDEIERKKQLRSKRAGL